jgi:AcrR family transcriptional regulator
VSRPGNARPAGRGRRTDGVDTRATILDAARAEFAAKGYDGTSVRGIARSAGVDAALVHHYFAGKEGVFAAAMHLPLDPAELVPRLLDGPLDEFGERVVRTFFSIWEDPASRAPILAMLRSAMTSEDASALLRDFVSSALLGRIAPALPPPDRELRTTLAVAQLVGTAVLRYVVRVEPLASAPVEHVVARLAPVIQRYLSPP